MQVIVAAKVPWEDKEGMAEVKEGMVEAKAEAEAEAKAVVTEEDTLLSSLYTHPSSATKKSTNNQEPNNSSSKQLSALQLWAQLQRRLWIGMRILSW